MDLFHAALSARIEEAEKRMAHGITHTSPAKVSGNHLVAENDEPEPFAFTEAELLAGDLERMQRGEQRFRDRLGAVHELELAYFRRMGFV